MKTLFCQISTEMINISNLLIQKLGNKSFKKENSLDYSLELLSTKITATKLMRVR
jgi:hypothetical protein